MILQSLIQPNKIVNVIITAIFAILAIFIFYKMMRYIRLELKTAPKYALFQRMGNFISGFTFSLIISISILFVLALISSAIGANSIGAINIYETKTHNEAEIDKSIILALSFPNLLPLSLMIVAVFTFIYPMYEYIKMAGTGQQGATEVQRMIEGKFIDRVNYPWSYLMAIIVFFFVVIFAPLIVSIIALTSWEPTGLSNGTVVGLIFFIWLLLGPIFYMSYYSNIGAVQQFLRGRRINLKKNKKFGFFYWIAILTFIVAITSFFSFIIPLFSTEGIRPTSNIEEQNSLIKNILDLIEGIGIKISDERRFEILLFFTVLPLEFIGFILMTAGFGLLGIYAKFISKEPLNTPKMVLFACYLICGIAFSIFVNAMIKWPWIFPTENLAFLGLDIDLSDSVNHTLVVRFFSIAIFVEKCLNLFFLYRFLFVRKELRQEADEWALNKGILENDFETITRYKTHENPEMRKIVADSVIRYVKIKDSLTPEFSKYISQILQDLLLDPNEEVTDLIKEHQYEIILKLDKESLVNTVINLMESGEPPKIKQALKIARQISKEEISYIGLILLKLTSKNLTDYAFNSFYSLVAEYDSVDHILIRELIIPLFEEKNIRHIYGGFNVIKSSITNFRNDIETLAPILKRYLLATDPKFVAKALDVYSSLAADNSEMISEVMIDIHNIESDDIIIIRQKIGSIVKFCITKPEWFDNLFEYIEAFLKSKNNSVVSDAAISLGSISLNVSKNVFFQRIFPHLKKLVCYESIDVKRSVIASLVIIAQTRMDLYNEEQFQHLFSILIIDESVEIRHKVFRFFIEGDPKIFINDIVAVLTSPISTQVRLDLLNNLALIADKIAPMVDEVGILNVLTSQNLTEQINLGIDDLDEIQDDKSKIFGFNRKINEINLIGATIALLYEIIYYIPDKIDEISDFLNDNVINGGDIALAKKLEFYCKITLDQLKSKSSMHSAINLDTTMNILNQNIYIVKPLTQKIVVDFLYEVYKFHPEKHEKIFELLVAITLQHEKADSETKRKILICMGLIFAKFPKSYFKSRKFKDLTKMTNELVVPFEKYFQPLILESLESTDSKIQNGISSALLNIVNVSEQEVLIRALLIDTIHQSKNKETKISAMKAIVSLPIKIDDKPTITVLLRQFSTKDIHIRTQAILSLGQIIKTFPQYNEKEKSKETKKLKALIYRSFYNQYRQNAPTEIKLVILEQLSTITLVQPNIPLCLSTIELIGLDNSPEIALKALDIFFQFVDLYPDKISEYMVIFRRLANSTLPEMNKKIVEKLLDLNKSGMNMDILYPSLIRLATASSREVRIISLDAFYDISKDNEEKYLYFLEILLRLSSNRISEIRKDVSIYLFKFAYLKINQDSILNRIIQKIQKLSSDSNVEVKFILSQNLDEISDRLPSRINDILQIVYNLLRASGNHSDIMENVAFSLKSMWKKYTNMNKEIMKNLERFYKKSQSAILYTVITELKNKE